MSAALLLIVLALGLLVAWVVTRLGSGTRPRGDERHWEERVLLQTRGNRGALERAVTAKRRQYPRASRAELLKTVHDEYVRDRNRS